MEKALAKHWHSSLRLVSTRWAREAKRQGRREMVVLGDWIIFLMVVALTISLINPLLIILLWIVG
jgi:hypothetical protein